MVLVALVMLINLRGVRESGVVFAIPTYFFVVDHVPHGRHRAWCATSRARSLRSPTRRQLHTGTVSAVTLFLMLHAFSSGTTALTGVEAISNGITAFKEPRSRNAGITLIWMACILGSLFLGISFLAGPIGAVPSEQETVISQLARTVFCWARCRSISLRSARPR